MVKNELAVLDGGEERYLALRPDSEIAEALAVNLVAGETISASDLVRVKTPAGGGTTWQWTDATGNEQTSKVIRGILAAYVPQGTLWGSETPQKGELPVLQTYDLTTARRVNDSIGDLDPDALEACRIGDRLYDWTRLPWNEFGSGPKGFGKRCKEARLLFVLQEGETWPVVLSAGPGSLKNITGFIKKLSVPHYRCEIEFSLTKTESSGGIDYSMIVPKLTRTLTREEGDVIRRLYTTPLSRLAQSFDVSSGE